MATRLTAKGHAAWDMTPGQLIFASRIEGEEDLREISLLGAGGRLAQTDEKGWKAWFKDAGK